MKSLLNNLTPEQHLKLLAARDVGGKIALHYAALNGRTKTVKSLLNNLTPEQQLYLFAVEDYAGKTASQRAADNKQKEIVEMLKYMSQERILELIMVSGKTTTCIYYNKR